MNFEIVAIPYVQAS